MLKETSKEKLKEIPPPVNTPKEASPPINSLEEFITPPPASRSEEGFYGSI